VPLIDTQTEAIEVGHTVRRRVSRILLKRSLPVWGIVLALYSVALVLVVGHASVLMRINRANNSQSAVLALCLPANWSHMD